MCTKVSLVVNLFHIIVCTDVAQALIEELDIRFPINYMLDLLGIVFP